ncbi:MAG: c-type cytochrome [Bacteroidetes bacterium]|nr:c-type cytochrome [Bacteroidota bacterium]
MKSIVSAGILILCIGLYAFRNGKAKGPVNETELGKMLFFDPVLSQNGTVSCASCHKPEFAFADTVAFSKGFDGRPTARNTPSAMNVSSRGLLFWDGRSPSLEHQALQPVINPVEMGMSLEQAVKRLRKSGYYRKAFHKIYHSAPTAALVGKAIAAYERTLETGDAPMDRFLAGDINAVNAEAIRGREIFLQKGHCFDCHFGPDYTADEMRNIGIFDGKKYTDSGRWQVTRKPEDIGKFKVPGLRNIALTAPYMHNGMFRTLEEVVEYYDDPRKFIPEQLYTDTLIKPLQLSTREKADLVMFLKSLTSSSLIK